MIRCEICLACEQRPPLYPSSALPISIEFPRNPHGSGHAFAHYSVIWHGFYRITHPLSVRLPESLNAIAKTA